MHVIAVRLFRTGLQKLLADGWGRYYVSLQNRTNNTIIEIPRDRVGLWYERLR